MKTFRIYKHATLGYEAVKNGFSWPAMIFSFWWMLVKRLWSKAALWFAFAVILQIVSVGLETMSPGAAQLAVALLVIAASLALALVPGFSGNRWRENRLELHGYQALGVAQARSADAAIAIAAEGKSLTHERGQVPAVAPTF